MQATVTAKTSIVTSAQNAYKNQNILLNLVVRAVGVHLDDLSALPKDLRFLLEPAFEAKLSSYMQLLGNRILPKFSSQAM